MSKQIPTRIQLHQHRVESVLKGGQPLFLPIADSCRFDNLGVLQIDSIAANLTDPGKCIAFIPAAGAATRYNAPFDNVLQFLRNGDIAGAKKVFQDVMKTISDCPLPKSLREINTSTMSEVDFSLLEQVMASAKALYPCVLDGTNFLRIKLMEHELFDFITAQIFVIPESQSSTFHHHIQRYSGTTKPVALLEQNSDLKTIRFDQDAKPCLDNNGEISWVPGGHGQLVSLFSKAKELSPEASSLFIRNIDNIQGNALPAKIAIENVAKFHQFILKNIVAIRQKLSADDFDGAERIAERIHTQLQKSWHISTTSPFPFLCGLQMNLFHSPSEFNETIDIKSELKALYNRPVNTLGQVPNQHCDVGGFPCFIRYKSKTIKVCLEGPHIAEQDQKRFVAGKSNLFFNPVCIFAELRTYADILDSDHPFWVIAKKKFMGQDVYYHEEMLSEILGNSQLANCIFASLPRSVFHPHKVIGDSRGRNLSDWF